MSCKGAKSLDIHKFASLSRYFLCIPRQAMHSLVTMLQATYKKKTPKGFLKQKTLLSVAYVCASPLTRLFF